MPEGDTLYRLAEALRPALLGKEVTGLDLPRSPISALAGGRRDFMIGQRVDKVEARGKNLLIHFSNEWLLHTHLKMNGRWRLFKKGEAFGVRATACVVLEVEGVVAVCREAPVARLLKPGSLERQRDLRGLGPDLCDPSFDPIEAVRRLRLIASAPLGVAIMDQRALSGIGNVYKSEILFNRKLDPFAPVSLFQEAELRALVDHARELLLANIAPRNPRSRLRGNRVTRHGYERGGPAQSVYRRVGQPCFDCRATIQMKRQGTTLRSTYFCPKCQPGRVAP
jgi:endonuclease-8